MPTKKNKLIYIVCFCIILLYTLYGIHQLGKDGGPCNGGIALIVFLPLTLFSAVTQLSVFLNPKSKALFVEIFVVWSLFMFMFAKDDSVVFRYLIPFFGLNLLTLIIMKRRKRNEAVS